MSESGHLETMEPNPVWVQDAYADTVDTLARYRNDLDYHIWGGDWCKDCRAQLPDFGAALEAAEISGARIHHYPTEKEDDGSKTGPGVEESWWSTTGRKSPASSRKSGYQLPSIWPTKSKPRSEDEAVLAVSRAVALHTFTVPRGGDVVWLKLGTCWYRDR